jgi:hypothetical protein
MTSRPRRPPIPAILNPVEEAPVPGRLMFLSVFAAILRPARAGVSHGSFSKTLTAASREVRRS